MDIDSEVDDDVEELHDDTPDDMHTDETGDNLRKRAADLATAITMSGVPPEQAERFAREAGLLVEDAHKAWHVAGRNSKKQRTGRGARSPAPSQ